MWAIQKMTIQTRDHEMSADPNAQNEFWVFILYFMYIPL